MLLAATTTAVGSRRRMMFSPPGSGAPSVAACPARTSRGWPRSRSGSASIDGAIARDYRGHPPAPVRQVPRIRCRTPVRVGALRPVRCRPRRGGSQHVEDLRVLRVGCLHGAIEPHPPVVARGAARPGPTPRPRPTAARIRTTPSGRRHWRSAAHAGRTRGCRPACLPEQQGERVRRGGRVPQHRRSGISGLWKESCRACPALSSIRTRASPRGYARHGPSHASRRLTSTPHAGIRRKQDQRSCRAATIGDGLGTAHC